MRKRIFVTLVMIGCMALMGCGGSKDSSVASGLAESYETSEDSEYEDAETDTEDNFMDDAKELSQEVNTNEGLENENPVDAEGIIMMTVYRQDWKRGVQIISIDPTTGKQNIIANFLPNYSVGIDDYSIKPPMNKIYGNDRNWISEDFTKMAATKTFVNTNESHAGWIDTDGNFYDVTERICALKESDFTDSDIAHQESVGFIDGKFVFCESGSKPYYTVPLDNLSEDAIKEVDEDYSLYCKDGKEAYPTDWVDETDAITDIYGIPSGGGAYYDSVIVDATSGEQTSYIPKSNRYNWSGILNPDKSMVAFFSVSANGGTLELYTIPISGGEPTNIGMIPNDNAIIDSTTLTKNDIYGHYGLEKELFVDSYCYLIGWK